MIKIIIADDHPIVRGGLKQTVAQEPDMELVGEATNTAELRELLRGISCDVLVLDVSMPGRSGLDVLKEISGKHPKIVVLVLTMHREDEYAVRALKSGAASFMTKDTAPEYLTAGCIVCEQNAMQIAHYVCTDG